MTVNMNQDVEMIRYESVYPDIHKTYSINNIEKRKLILYIKHIKPLTDKEKVKLALKKDIEIRYGDDITISIQGGYKNYCYYENKKENIHKLARMPRGLYNLVIKKVDKK